MVLAKHIVHELVTDSPVTSVEISSKNNRPFPAISVAVLLIKRCRSYTYESSICLDGAVVSRRKSTQPHRRRGSAGLCQSRAGECLLDNRTNNLGRSYRDTPSDAERNHSGAQAGADFLKRFPLLMVGGRRLLPGECGDWGLSG